MPLPDDPFARIPNLPVRPPVLPVNPDDPSPAGVLRAGFDEVQADPNSDVITEGGAISVVGSDGKLNLVPKHSTWATPTTYPTVLKMVNGSVNVLIDSTGVVITNASGFTCSITFAALARNLAIRTVTVCDAGVSKSMDILASAPY